ncbi:MAG: hypothetical protein V1644_03740 [Candidatus Micrarchaeota archaeon]
MLKDLTIAINMVNGVFTAVIAGGILLAFAGLIQLEHLLIFFVVGGIGKKLGQID